MTLSHVQSLCTFEQSHRIVSEDDCMRFIARSQASDLPYTWNYSPRLSKRLSHLIQFHQNGNIRMMHVQSLQIYVFTSSKPLESVSFTLNT